MTNIKAAVINILDKIKQSKWLLVCETGHLELQTHINYYVGYQPIYQPTLQFPLPLWSI